MDFVVNKVIKRSFTAALGPLSIYAAFFGIGRAIN